MRKLAERGDAPETGYLFDDRHRGGRSEPLFDFRSNFRALYRNRYLIIGTVAICLALGVLSILLGEKVYSATSKVQIGREVSSPLGDIGSRFPASQTDDERALQTQADLLNTREMAVAVIRRVAQQRPQPAFVRRLDPRRMQGNLTLVPPRNSRILPITFSDVDPSAAALIANNYAEALIATNLRTRFDSSAYARDYLRQELGGAKGRLEQSERSLVDYARAAGVVEANDEPASDRGPLKSLTTASLSQLNAAYSTAKSTRIQAQQRWQQAQSTPVMSLPEVVSNGTIQQLAGQRAELMAKLQDNRARYNDRHPLVQQGAASVAELDRQIGTVAGRVRNSLQDQYLVAARQENSLASGVGELRGQRLDEQDRLIRYNILKREVDTNRELYDGLLQRFKQVSAEAGATNNNISIVDRAYASRIPISPNPTNILGLAGIAGLMLALLLVFLREQLTDRIGDPAEVERAIGARLLSVVPKLKGEGRMENAILEAGSPFTEVFHSLRTAIELGENPVPRSILVTSSKSKEGKSSVSLGLARSFAEAGQRVLLIDGDLRLPSLAAYMGMENGPGLAEVLVDGLLLRQAVRRSENFGLDLLTAGKRTDDPAVLLDPDKLRAIVTEAGGLYDMIIIDGPPALGIADATRLGNVAEGAIFVVKSEGVTKEEARLAIKRLREARINVIGAVLSMFEPERGNTAYRYAYGDDQKAAA